MNLGELITEFRSRTGDDVPAKYRFSDELVTGFANQAESEAAIRAKLLYDTDNVTILANKSIYDLDDTVFEIDSAVITDSSGVKKELILIDRPTLDKECPFWREATNSKPKYLIQDEGKYEVTPIPDADYMMALNHYRTPINLMYAESSEPEIKKRHHDGLVDWMVRQSMQVKDIDASDLSLAPDAEAKFIARFGIRRDANVMRKQARKGAHTVKAIRF